MLLCHETSGARGESRDVTVILQETIEDLKSVIVTETNSASKETVDKVVTRLRHVRSPGYSAPQRGGAHLEHLF